VDTQFGPPAPWKRLAGYAIALALLGGAVWSLMREKDLLAGTWDAVRLSPWWMMCLWLLLPALNWVFSSHLAWALLRPQHLQPRLSKPEMYEIIGAAWLANLLPLRAGLISRAVYHVSVNRIPLGTVARSVVVAVALGLIASVWLILAAFLLHRLSAGALLTIAVLAAPYPVLLLAGAASPVADPGRTLTGGFGRWRLLDALAARYADILCWMARYWLAFSLAGHPVTLTQAAVFAAASQLVMLVPLPGNAIGLRELLIGFIAPFMPAAISGDTGALTQGIGVAADLINRAAELIATLMVGSACTGLLAQRLRFRLD
jgi:hypothetical protein